MKSFLPASILLLIAPAIAIGAEPPRVSIPELPVVPLMIDGRIDAGEWAGAAEIVVDDGLRLLLKQSSGHVYIAVDTPGETPQPLDLYLVPSDPSVRQLHASMQLGERQPTPSEPEPAWRWGNNVGWTASTLRRDPQRADAEQFAAQLYPADGSEIQIDRARFPGTAWRVRITIDAIPGNDRAFTYPQDSTTEPSTWAIWELDPPSASAERLSIASDDGIDVIADVYPHPDPNAPILLAAHRAGWSRGEYAPTAGWFNAQGFHVVAIDQRSGWEVNGARNETAARARAAGLPTAFIDAQADIERALAHLAAAHPGRPLLLMGSSYSSALILRIAGENRFPLSAVISFAPGEYFPDTQYLGAVTGAIQVPTFITSARHEQPRWQPFAQNIAPELLHAFVPEGPGLHGSQALWTSTAGHEEYRAALGAFLARFVR